MGVSGVMKSGSMSQRLERHVSFCSIARVVSKRWRLASWGKMRNHVGAAANFLVMPFDPIGGAEPDTYRL